MNFPNISRYCLQVYWNVQIGKWHITDPHRHIYDNSSCFRFYFHLLTTYNHIYKTALAITKHLHFFIIHLHINQYIYKETPKGKKKRKIQSRNFKVDWGVIQSACTMYPMLCGTLHCFGQKSSLVLELPSCSSSTVCWTRTEWRQTNDDSSCSSENLLKVKTGKH